MARKIDKAIKPSDVPGIKKLIAKSTYYLNKSKTHQDEIDAIEKACGEKAPGEYYLRKQICFDMHKDYESAYMTCYHMFVAYKEETGQFFDPKETSEELKERLKKEVLFVDSDALVNLQNELFEKKQELANCIKLNESLQKSDTFYRRRLEEIAEIANQFSE